MFLWVQQDPNNAVKVTDSLTEKGEISSREIMSGIQRTKD